jgi:hypothetical protein
LHDPGSSTGWSRARARNRTSSVAAACEIILRLGVHTEGTAPRQDDLQAS